MISYEAFREREVIIVLAVGIAIVLYIILFYVDLWKPRKLKEGQPSETETRYLSVWEGIPWTIRVIAVIIVLSMAAYTVYLFTHPMNW